MGRHRKIIDMRKYRRMPLSHQLHGCLWLLGIIVGGLLVIKIILLLPL